MYTTGKVIVTAQNANSAIEKVQTMINTGKLQTTDIDWDTPQYEDSSFDVTGDVEEVNISDWSAEVKGRE